MTSETIIVQIDNEPDIKFSGKLIASAKSSCESSMGSSYSGESGRWTEMFLYKTDSGKYVCERIGRTKYMGETDRFSGAVCDNVSEVIEFFGHRWLAKELYKKAGIDDVIEI